MARPTKITEDAGTDAPAETPTPERVVTPAMSAGPAAKTRPIRTFRIDNVSASVWAKLIVKVESFTVYSITFERHYEDAKGNQKYTHWFNLNDLPKLVSLCQQAEQYIIELQRAELAKKTEQAPPAQ